MMLLLIKKRTGFSTTASTLRKRKRRTKSAEERPKTHVGLEIFTKRRRAPSLPQEEGCEIERRALARAMRRICQSTFADRRNAGSHSSRVSIFFAGHNERF